MDNIELVEQRTHLVVKDNDLIQKASYRLTLEEQKMLCYVISKIKPTDKEFQRYTISAKDFCEVAGIDPKHVYRDFKKMIDDFEEHAQWIKIGDDNIYFRAFSEAEYNENNGSITLMLNSRLKQYLLDIGRHGQYTQYELWNILGLKSKYSLRLYELFRSYSYKTEMTFQTADLQSLLCAENYKYGDFKKRALDPGIKEINESTDLQVDYRTLRKGKGGKATEITFHVAKKDADGTKIAWYKTIDKLNQANGQLEGQYSIFDYDLDKQIEKELAQEREQEQEQEQDPTKRMIKITGGEKEQQGE